MTNRTTRALAETGLVLAPPPDIATMRETVGILLDPDAVALGLAGAELGKLTRVVRGHLELLVPEVERAAGKLEQEGVLRYCALEDMHAWCRQTKDVPLPHSTGILLVPRCRCSCHRAGGCS
ncbi:DUF6415 family natural product biosynthesis protein [Streptomyces sp. NBC_01485]|uniref:DUF6415 family natural product biosynthesis protein n=1 Tax=Streptomyces sp. NBC_01485 TaxID=2903884 RepID=UPI002E3002CF|nr:DUF6415 family natural product biosynthesis protein [Streptomyces sp. NBC_01485]